ncbi:MAG: hypothetical protein OHK0040_04410 [bacterium]
MKVLGISGSPIKNSNTDKAVMAILELRNWNMSLIYLGKIGNIILNLQ